MSDGKHHPARESSSSAFSSTPWDGIAVTPDGRVVRRSEAPSDSAAPSVSPDAEKTATAGRTPAQRRAHAPDSPSSPPASSTAKTSSQRHHREAPERDKEGLKPSTVLLRYPFVGQFRPATDPKYGFIRIGRVEWMAHTNEIDGREVSTTEGLDGKYCAAALGGNPFRYARQKSD